MDYRILITDKYLKQSLERIFDIERKDNEPIDFYHNLIGYIPSRKVKDFPHFLTEVINEGGIDYNSSGFCFGPITEGEKVWLEKGLVEIYVMKDKTILSAKDFFELALEFANKALEAVVILGLKEKRIVDDTWIRTIEDSIPKLQAKLNEY
jgi:hypothetical protein